jgi:mono/diheme cytochrome c family protein
MTKLMPPKQQEALLQRLLQAVTSTIYKHALLGNGFHGFPWNCNTCHSVNHRLGLYLFPLLPGWFIAGTPKTIVDFHTSVSHNISHQAAAERAQRDTSHGRGTPCR